MQVLSNKIIRVGMNNAQCRMYYLRNPESCVSPASIDQFTLFIYFKFLPFFNPNIGQVIPFLNLLDGDAIEF